jgi:hypothetical protein
MHESPCNISRLNIQYQYYNSHDLSGSNIQGVAKKVIELQRAIVRELLGV